MTTENMTEFANQVKEVLVNNLLENKVITKEQHALVSEDYCVVVTPKDILGRVFDKVRNRKDTEKLLITVLKGQHVK
jgi:glycerol-3-phosphate dehydrogenase